MAPVLDAFQAIRIAVAEAGFQALDVGEIHVDWLSVDNTGDCAEGFSDVQSFAIDCALANVFIVL